MTEDDLVRWCRDTYQELRPVAKDDLRTLVSHANNGNWAVVIFVGGCMTIVANYLHDELVIGILGNGLGGSGRFFIAVSLTALIALLLQPVVGLWQQWRIRNYLARHYGLRKD